MQHTKKIIFVAIFSLVLIGITFATQEKQETDPLPSIAVTTFPIFDIVKHVSEDTLNILNVVPFGKNTHNYKPTLEMITKLENSELLIYSGAGLESWTKDLSFKNTSINLSEYVKLRELGINEFEHHVHHDHQCAHATIDPHYWLDIKNMVISTNVITQELIKMYPEHKKLYIENAQKYMRDLEALDKEYKKELNFCRIDSIVTNHNAFAYLSDKYHFSVNSLSGFAPQEANAKNIVRIKGTINNERIPIIFFESFADSNAIKSIANDLHLHTDILETLANITVDQSDNNVSYEMLMRENLVKLSKALICD